MDNKDIYKIWAPDDAQWTQWAKPVLFMNLPRIYDSVLPLEKVSWIRESDRRTMIIADLPAQTSVDEGMSLARIGFRPVPLYNGVRIAERSAMLVDNYEITVALYAYTRELSELRLPDDAPPVFLLDSNRSNSGKTPGKYDNRWLVFPQDMPSAAYLLKNGIERVIVRSEKIRHDLSHILYRYQQAGIQIFRANDWTIAEETIHAPFDFKNLFYRFGAIMGLTRNAAGGFGSMVPMPSESSGYGYVG